MAGSVAPFYIAECLDTATEVATPNRAPFDAAICALVEHIRPAVVSFHFGLPAADLLTRLKASGAEILSSATTVRAARWPTDHGVDAIMAQGYKAGGHRGTFLDIDISAQPGIFALLPQVVDSVAVPAIAAGGIADSRGMAAAFALGATGVQIGTAFLPSPKALISPVHQQALATASSCQNPSNQFIFGLANARPYQ